MRSSWPLLSSLLAAGCFDGALPGAEPGADAGVDLGATSNVANDAAAVELPPDDLAVPLNQTALDDLAVPLVQSALEDLATPTDPITPSPDLNAHCTNGLQDGRESDV